MVWWHRLVCLAVVASADGIDMAPFGSVREGAVIDLEGAEGSGGYAADASLCSTDYGSQIGKPEGYWQGLQARHGVNESRTRDSNALDLTLTIAERNDDPGREMLDCFSRNELTQLNRTVEKYTPVDHHYYTRRHLRIEFAAFTSEGRQTEGGDQFSAYLYLESALSSDAARGLESGRKQVDADAEFFKADAAMTKLEGFVQDLENGEYIVHFATSVAGRYAVVLQHNFRCYEALYWAHRWEDDRTAGDDWSTDSVGGCFTSLPGSGDRPADLSVKDHPARAVLARVNVESPEVPDGPLTQCSQIQQGLRRAASGMWVNSTWRPNCCDLDVVSQKARDEQPIKFVGDSTMPNNAFHMNWVVYKENADDPVSYHSFQDWLANVVPDYPSNTVLALNPAGLHLLDRLPWEDAKAATVDMVCSVLSRFKGAGVALIGTMKVNRENHPEVRELLALLPLSNQPANTVSPRVQQIGYPTCLMTDARVNLLNEWTYEQIEKQGGFIHFNSSRAARAADGFVCRRHRHDGRGNSSVAVRLLDPHGFLGPLAREYLPGDIRHLNAPMFFSAYAAFMQAMAHTPGAPGSSVRRSAAEGTLLCDPSRAKRDRGVQRGPGDKCGSPDLLK